MLRLYHVLLGVILLLLTPLGVKFVLPYFSSHSNAQPTPLEQSNSAKTRTQSTSLTTPNPSEGNIWKKILDVKTTNNSLGWNVTPCQGNAPLLCVSSKKELLGTVELGVYPLENLPQFQKMLAAAGITPRVKENDQSPQYRTKVAAALKAWVDDHYAVLAKDRQATYGKDITFLTQLPQKVNTGRLQGMYYGFAGIKRGGGIQERHVGYVTYDGKYIYVITTGFDPASITGKFDKLENFQSFEAYLNAIAKNVNLP
ncbi:MAG: hypothetical protein ACHBN1_03845 [Heteroscytonema crispum UTEX LB 1556]